MGHLVFKPGSDGKSRFDKTPPEWLAVGAQVGELVNKWSGRSDIVPFVGDGAGGPAPACFVPAIAEMEINREVCFGKETDPEFIGDLRKRSIQFDHPAAMGAVLHEAMHAKHSSLDLLKDIFDPKNEPDKFVRNLAEWFEETRIESRGVKAFPKNKAFLRACALKIVLGDLKEDPDFAGKGIKAFSHLILLSLARVDAGVLKKKDVKPIQKAFADFFDADIQRKLRGIWVRAQAHNDDHNGEPLLALAREWVEVLKESENDPADDPSGEGLPEWLKELLKNMMGEGGDGEGGEEDGEGSGPGILVIMAEDAEMAGQDEANDQAVQEIMDAIAEAKAEKAKEQKDHKDAEKEVFGRGTGPLEAATSSRLRETRDPTPDERRAAVTLAKKLDQAKYRDRVAVKRSSVVPPGRLVPKRAVAAAEQRTRGAEITAEPWQRKQRKHTDEPPLTIGYLCDISGSMSSSMEPMASAAWVTSEAGKRVQAHVASVYYGNDVFPVLKPGQYFDKVHVYTAPDGTEKFDKAFRALNGALNLIDGQGARLLVICSDLHYTGYEGERTLYWMRRCVEAGVAVVVVPMHYEDTAKERLRQGKVRGVELIPAKVSSGNIVGVAQAIGAAAIRQLQVVSS
jgi:hypothetical protein